MTRVRAIRVFEKPETGQWNGDFRGVLIDGDMMGIYREIRKDVPDGMNIYDMNNLTLGNRIIAWYSDEKHYDSNLARCFPIALPGETRRRSIGGAVVFVKRSMYGGEIIDMTDEDVAYVWERVMWDA